MAILLTACAPFLTGSSFQSCEWHDIQMLILVPLVLIPHSVSRVLSQSYSTCVYLRTTCTGLLIKGLVPLLVILVIAIATSARTCAHHGLNAKNLLFGGLQAMPLALFISFCACPSVSSSIFQSWLCGIYTHVCKREQRKRNYGFTVRLKCTYLYYIDTLY